MTNQQVEAARRAINRYRAVVKLETIVDGEAETITPYLIASPETQGTPVMVTRETPASEVTRLFTASVRDIV